MAKQLFEIEGFEEFKRAVEQLPQKQKRSEILKVIRRSTKPTIDAARRLVPKKSGRLQRAIGNITSKNKEYPNILVGPRARGKHEGFHGALVEFGHGGPSPAPANPYMRPAFEQTKNGVSEDLANKIAKYIEKRANALSR